MINQEDLYKYLYQENWKEILDILYNEKEKIKNDPLLTFASKTFVDEFLKKVETYDLADKEILNHLVTLNILHHGKFYILTEENHKKLTIEIIKRKPLEEAQGYAKYYPNDDYCKTIIAKYISSLSLKGKNTKSQMNTISIELYNRLFELMNNQSDTATYFSGPRFMDTVRQFSPYFPTYHQYMEKRHKEGKSTTRKVYYFDILQELNEDVREKVVQRILEIIKPFESEKVLQIENIIEDKNVNIKIDKTDIYEKAELPIKEDTQSTNPIVFISYSWDDEEHKNWVLELAQRLSNDGVEVILDRYSLSPGANLQHFIENNIEKADRILIIFTPNYKLRADKRTGGVGVEYSIMNVELYRNITSTGKIIPLLRKGTMVESIPTFMQQFIHIDIRNESDFENGYNELIREIYKEPKIKKPIIGKKPDFK